LRTVLADLVNAYQVDVGGGFVSYNRRCPLGAGEIWYRAFQSLRADERDFGFTGPCGHGRDPYDRCDTCALLTPTEAAVLAERMACAKLVRELGDEEGMLPKTATALGVSVAILARGDK
jgi:hypothetical protein